MEKVTVQRAAAAKVVVAAAEVVAEVADTSGVPFQIRGVLRS